MTTITAGQLAGEGVYLSFRYPDVQVVSGDETKLNGIPGAQYHKLPLIAVVAFAPIIGGLFAVFFPFIIFAAFVRAVGEWIWRTRTYRTGETVPWGIYIGVSRPAVAYVGQSGTALRHIANVRFVRLPTLLVVLGCPVLGLLYVLLFPALMTLALMAFVIAALMSKLLGRPLPKGPWFDDDHERPTVGDDR